MQFRFSDPLLAVASNRAGPAADKGLAPTAHFVVWLVLAASGSADALAHQSVDIVAAQIAAVDEFHEVAISPDGQRVAWVERTAHGGSAIFLLAANGRGTPRRITAVSPKVQAGATQEKDLAWSADGAALAFLSDAESPGQWQLYITRDGSTVRRLTAVGGFIATPQWSPDGNRIAILFIKDSRRASGPTEAAAPAGDRDEQPIYEQRIATVDVVTGRISMISPADLYIYQYDWSPSGTQFVATAAHGPGDDNWYSAQLFIVDAMSGNVRSIFKPSIQIADPRWSPNGKSIAFIAGLNSDESIASGEIYCIPAEGGIPQNVTPNLRGSAYWVTWLPRSDRILFAEAVDGASGIGQVAATKDGVVHLLWKGAQSLTGPAGFARGLSIARDGWTTAVIAKSFDKPPQIFVGRVGAWHALTRAYQLKYHLWGKADSVIWLSDGLHVQGWVLYPAAFNARHKYPLVVWLHGGPAWLSAPDWPAGPFFPDMLLASQGYFVFYPNPRGSAGFGEAFKRAVVRDLGGGDLRDILAGIREVLSTLPIDDTRVGIGGWSYGGDMTMWALTQTTQFHAAFAGAGTADLLSYYGENDFHSWLLPYFGASIYDDPKVYAKSSPINFIKNVRTPTLLAVGDSDIESPALQSREYWNALKTFGIKTKLLIYPHEGHDIRDPGHVRDLMNRIVLWFDDNMPPQHLHR
jgi:dipeptidyl aminopeptidase/acylaminoacyl peptidase